MDFNILDTQDTYRRLFAAPAAATRQEIFYRELVEPFGGVIDVFGGDGMAAFAMWGMSPDQAEPGGRWHEAFNLLVQHDAWTLFADALRDAQTAFAPYADRIGLSTVTAALMLANLGGNPLDRGYTGFGGVPGWVMVNYSTPNAYNLPRLQGTTVHELHHNVRFSMYPFNPMQTNVGDYIIAEGLAEAFAAERYGAGVVGYYVTDFDAAQLATAKAVIGGALGVTGFNEVRGYIFGDALAEAFGFPPAGVPSYAGYAVGYRVVQAYIQRTGKTVAETTFLPADEIIRESRFFG